MTLRTGFRTTFRPAGEQVIDPHQPVLAGCSGKGLSYPALMEMEGVDPPSGFVIVLSRKQNQFTCDSAGL